MTEDQIRQEIQDDQKDVLNPKDFSNTTYYTRKDYMDVQLAILKEFLLTKKIEGCKASTISDYHDKVIKLIEWSDKDIRELTTRDIRRYLSYYQTTRPVQDSTVDQIRIVLSTFYGFLENEEFILRNPVRGIKKIKTDEKIRLPFTDEDIEIMRNAVRNIRDLAIIDLFASSGMRIGELISLNIKDVNFDQREMIVYGKGGKERLCYFNARTKIEILDYLSTRHDKNPALFVQRKYPYERFQRGGIRHMLNDIENRTGIVNIHPHRFRRTLATSLLEKGMSLEQVKVILGHKRIETTLVYAGINQTDTKMNHQRYT